MDSAGSHIRFHDSRSGTLSAAALQRMSSRGSAASSGDAMYDARSAASSPSSSSLMSPSGSGLLLDARFTTSSGTSGEVMHDAPSSAFSNSLHRLSSDGTNASSGSGTEWYEAGEADSDFASRSGSFKNGDEVPPEPEQAQAGRRLDLALLQAVDSSAAGVLGRAEGAAGSVPGGRALLRVADAQGETSSAADLGPAMLRILIEVPSAAMLRGDSMHDKQRIAHAQRMPMFVARSSSSQHPQACLLASSMHCIWKRDQHLTRVPARGQEMSCICLHSALFAISSSTDELLSRAGSWCLRSWRATGMSSYKPGGAARPRAGFCRELTIMMAQHCLCTASQSMPLSLTSLPQAPEVRFILNVVHLYVVRKLHRPLLVMADINSAAACYSSPGDVQRPTFLKEPLCCSGEGFRVPCANIKLASHLDARMLGAALVEATITDVRAALGLETAGADCNIRVPEKQAAGLLCALRNGQVLFLAHSLQLLENVQLYDCPSLNVCIGMLGPSPVCIVVSRVHFWLGECACAGNRILHLHMSQDIFCFLLQGKIRWPSSAADEGPMVSADFGDLALWASQRRLCLALSLLAAAKDAALKMEGGAASGSRARQTKVSIELHLAAAGLSNASVWEM